MAQGMWDGAVAIVTGGASGIGRALGEALAAPPTRRLVRLFRETMRLE